MPEPERSMYQNELGDRMPKFDPPLGEMLMWPLGEMGAVPLGREVRIDIGRGREG
jgi:hypothetical protein